MKAECRDCGILVQDNHVVLIYERIGELVPLCIDCYNKSKNPDGVA